MTVQIEDKKRLSRSVLWKLQKEAYQQFSVKAWTEKGVPFYLTSNPYTAKLYALTAFAYLKDCAREGSPTPLDENHPVYIFDLGAGSGRFSYLFLRHLLSLMEAYPPLTVKPCLVMTDIVPSNIDFWERHTYLQKFFNDWVLDVAYYHHDQEKPIKLISSQKTLIPETVVNPIILIGNYFFDTIPQDYFRIKDGQLEEGLISLQVKKADEKEMIGDNNPNIINRLDYSYYYQPVENVKDYYSDSPSNNQLLQNYCDTFDNAHFLFPVGALDCLRYFETLSKGRFLLIAGDQGICTEKQVLEWGEPKMSKHGSFSFPVSYHLLSSYFQMRGGEGLMTQYSDPAFVNLVAIAGSHARDYPETVLTFREQFDAFEPKDYWRLINSVEEHWKLPSLDFLLYSLKLGCYDPVNFYFFFNIIRVQLPTASLQQRNLLAAIIEKVWENFFPVDPAEGDFVMNLAVLLFNMKQYEKALKYFDRCRQFSGEKAILYLNMASCYQCLQDTDNFERCMQKTKELQNLVLPDNQLPPFLK